MHLEVWRFSQVCDYVTSFSTSSRNWKLLKRFPNKLDCVLKISDDGIIMGLDENDSDVKIVTIKAFVQNFKACD